MTDGRLLVLLVDDNPQDRALVAREVLLAFPEAEIVEAIDQQQLDRAVLDIEFDLVITDYQLLWTTGLSVLAAVKANQPRCPVIMFTATGNEEIAVQAMKEGLDDYIIKNVKHLVRLRAAARTVVEHAKTAQEVDRLERRLGSLLSSLRVGVFRCSLDGRLTDVNGAFLRILGYTTPGSIVGTPLRNLFDSPPEYDRYLRLYIDEQQVRDFELEARRADGQKVWVSVSLSMQASDKQEIAICGLLDDISHRRQMEEDLRTRDIELAHLTRLATLGEMVAGIAHEINQPLHVIANYATGSCVRLEKGQLDVVQFKEALSQISSQVTRATDILARYRGFASRRPTKRSKFPINDFLRKSVQMLAYDMRAHRVSIRWDLSSSELMVVADENELCQVTINLVRNACEAMRQNQTGSAEIVVSTREVEGNVEVSIQDQGHGLPADGFHNLLQPFVTTKPDGMGMGLAVSSRIVETHGGRLWATPNTGPGATFHFTLPLDQ